jgi:hypothetical protein
MIAAPGTRCGNIPGGLFIGPGFGRGLFSLSQDLILAMVPEIIFWGTN